MTFGSDGFFSDILNDKPSCIRDIEFNDISFIQNSNAINKLGDVYCKHNGIIYKKVGNTLISNDGKIYNNIYTEQDIRKVIMFS